MLPMLFQGLQLLVKQAAKVRMIELINNENSDAFRQLRGRQFQAVWAFNALKLAVKR